jgi:hypothetical protein
MKKVSRSNPQNPARAGGAQDRSTPTTASATRKRIREETRAQMLERLTNPQITLHEASVILRVCPATVRNYCNAGYLPHERTPGRQRRFRLHDVLALAREREDERRKRK